MDETQIASILSAFDTKLATDPQIRVILRKITGGKATLADTAVLSDRAADLLGEVLGAAVLDIPEDVREAVCEGLLRERYDFTMNTCDGVLEALDNAQGLHLTPQHPGFPIERVQQLASSLTDPNAKPETIQRRASKPVATVAKSFHDSYIRINAQTRHNLGIRCYLDRVAATGCCAWCTGIAGRYVYGEHPADIFRRHDNCSCTVTFENGRERQDVWSKRTWDAKDPKEIERVASRPAKLAQQQAESLQNTALSRLTLGGKRDIMDATHKMGAPKQQPPDFSLYTVKEDPDAVDAVKRMMVDELGIPEDKIDLTGIKNADVLEPFMKRWKRIQNETGMSFPYVQAVEIIDSDPTCVAGVPDNADRFYISSKFFNSKEALLDTLKDWAEKDIMPKQCKSIAFIAEHEAAHIRIPDELLNTDEAYTIWKRRKLTNDNDFDIYEFFADITAIFRLNKNTEDASVLKAVNYLVEGGVSL